MSGFNVTCTSEVTAERDEYLLAHQIKEWVETLPDGAQVVAITRQMGDQRDPYTSTVGLKATWSETRFRSAEDSP